ncbi:hypothetical protein B0H14DRAFT_2590105 [Mycena olivaceomarginata]|nr:hypothetical protein B0H14DRAFT_2590105 [Mycena olivaceomarginata]
MAVLGFIKLSTGSRAGDGKRQLIPLLPSFICPTSSTPPKRLLSDKSGPLQPVSRYRSNDIVESTLFNSLLFAGNSSRARFMARAVRLSTIPHQDYLYGSVCGLLRPSDPVPGQSQRPFDPVQRRVHKRIRHGAERWKYQQTGADAAKRRAAEDIFAGEDFPNATLTGVPASSFRKVSTSSYFCLPPVDPGAWRAYPTRPLQKVHSELQEPGRCGWGALL